jgi:Ca-activated chloride channel family protein
MSLCAGTSFCLDSAWWLLLFLALPFLAWPIFKPYREGRVGFSDTRSLRRVAANGWAWLWWLPQALRIAALAAFVVALARPQIPDDEHDVQREGVDIMIALDMSISMQSVDVTQEEVLARLASGEPLRSRFEIARDILKAFIGERKTDRLGLVIFGSTAWLKQPLTSQQSRLIAELDKLVLDYNRSTDTCLNGCTIPGDGTAIGDALGRAYNRLRRSTAKSRLIVLITDGKQEGGKHDAEALTRHIRDQDPGIRLYTFLVGQTGESWELQRDRRGRLVVDPAGRPIPGPGRKYPIDPELLQRLADMTGGKYYASYSEEKFKASIADLEKTVFVEQVVNPRKDVFPAFVIGGMLALLLEFLLRLTRLRSIV